MDNWIFVESYHNWQQDFKNNFKYLGIDVKKIFKLVLIAIKKTKKR